MPYRPWLPGEEDAMRALRENMVPVAFLAVWMAASIYTMDALASMRPSRTVAASMDVTVTAPARAAARTSCHTGSAPVAADI